MPGLVKLKQSHASPGNGPRGTWRRMENIRFCRQYLVFHDGGSMLLQAWGNSMDQR